MQATQTLPYRSAPVQARRTVHKSPLARLRTDRWTVSHAVAAAFMALLGVLATYDAWDNIYYLAMRETEYSHIFLVPIVAAWMVFVRRLRFRHCRPAGTIVAVPIVAAGWAVHSFGFYHGYQTLWHAGAVLVVLGCVVSVLGKQLIFRFFPALAVLVFLIPVPPTYRLMISQPLQTWTAHVSQVVLEIFNVPVLRTGSKLSVNGIPVSIAEPCNGLRMVFALILVSYAFSFSLPLRNSVRLLVLLASPVSAIVCNVVRIVPTACVFGYYSNAAGTRFHDFSGWLMLPISFLILLGIIKALRWAMIPVMKYTLVS